MEVERNIRTVVDLSLIHIFNQLWVDAKWMGTNATCNFWRSAENFSINKYCMWANSQAVSLRRVNSSDGIVLSDGEGWSSGGFIADSKDVYKRQLLKIIKWTR